MFLHNSPFSSKHIFYFGSAITTFSEVFKDQIWLDNKKQERVRLCGGLGHFASSCPAHIQSRDENRINMYLEVIVSRCLHLFDGFESLISQLGLDTTRYNLHSFRFGGAVVSANIKTSERLWQRLNRWKSIPAKTRMPITVLKAVCP